MPAPRIDLPWRESSTGSADAILRLAKAVDVTPITADLLWRRGYQSARDAGAFLEPDNGFSHDPLKMKGMAAVAARIGKAIGNKERILVFGDYDADGIPGTALLANYLRFLRGKVDTYIPPRENGYGLTPQAAADLLAMDPRPELVITVDCGSSDHEGIRALQSVGIDVIVTDHHLALKGVPPTPWFVNPSRPDGETYPFPFLCGCGVAYKVVQALTRERHIPALYDLVAISTVGDQVSLTGENRFYVKAALAALNGRWRGNIGLRALAEVSATALETLTAEEIAWRIAPRINAVGRMGADPNMVVELLMTADHGRAESLAREFNRMNQQRRGVTDGLFEEALAQIGRNPPDFIVANLPSATIGVAGLVAARIVDHYQRPTLVVNAEGRGSGRAPRGSEIMPYMEELRRAGVFGRTKRLRDGTEVTPDFGGHAGACGFHNVDIGELRQAASRLRAPKGTIGAIEVDGSIPLAAVTERLAREMIDLSPFGVGNPEPMLVFPNLTVVEAGQTKYGKLVLTLSDGQTTRNAAWRGAGDLFNRLPAKIDLAGYPELSTYSGQVEIKILAIKPA